MKKSIFTFLLLLPVLAAIGQSSLQQEVSGYLTRNEEHLLSLAQDTPADKFSWRPAEGVRSVGETLLHVASANYFITSGMGFPLPEGVDVSKIETLTDKQQIIETLKKSFAFAKESIGKIKNESLTEKFKLPFGEFTKQMGLLILLEHSGEHKGQLIAYARANGIAPSWSKGGQE